MTTIAEKPRRTLVAGIDFGTSYSKVVLREQAIGRDAVVVTFAKHPDGLLDSLVGIDDGRLVPPAALDDCACVPYLKMLAAQSADGSPLDRGPVHVPAALTAIRQQQGDAKVIRDLLSFYFAHVMAGIEDFIRKHSPWRNFDLSPDNKKDYLVFQLAVPTGLLDNDGATERLFRKAFIVAYELRTKVDPQMVKPHLYSVWAEQVDEIVSVGLPGLEQKHPWQCLHYPEVLAAMQTVFRSPNPQQDGLYITMDVGAGTVELNAFRRNTGEHLPPQERTNAQRNHDYYSMSVRPLGIHNLHDPHGLVVPRARHELVGELRNEITMLYHRATVRQPNHGHVPGTRTWDRGRFMIFGGGARLAPYREAFHDALERQPLAIHLPQISDLPAPTDLQRPTHVDFGRFAVAYGMSFFRPNLDDWRPPNDILPFNDLYPPDPNPPPPYGFNWDD